MKKALFGDKHVQNTLDPGGLRLCRFVFTVSSIHVFLSKYQSVCFFEFVCCTLAKRL